VTLSHLLAARGGAGSARGPRNWRVASRLIILVTIPAVLGLALAGLRVAGATGSARAYGQVTRLAALGQQVTGLAQDMEQERGESAAFVAGGRPAASLPALRRQYAVTDGQAAAVRRLARQLGGGYPARTRASTAAAMASMAELPGLRRQAAVAQAPGLAVLSGYSAAIAGLFPVIDGIADPSGNAVLITSVRALGALSRMTDETALQQAVLGASLATGQLAPGAFAVLNAAQALQASDLASFRSSATPAESRALAGTMASASATRAAALEQRVTAGGPGALALGARAPAQWQAGTSATVGWMRQAQRQLAGWVTAYAGSLRQGAMRSAMITGGAALAVLLLALLVTLIIVRSIVRPLRRLEAAALDLAGDGLPAEMQAAAAGGGAMHPAPVEAMDVLATDEIGQVARAVSRVHREAVRLAGDEARQRTGVSAIFASSVQRSYFLLEHLLRLIDTLELDEDDPARLASLFQVDHLATRMRRNADRALVLAGHETPGRRTEPVALVDVLRAAASEIEHYDRVTLNVQLDACVAGSAATDTVHLLAELLENGTAFSPETAPVVVSAATSPDGDLVISVTDAGPGMSEGQLRWLNWQLAHPPQADETLTRHLGLFAVAHLAARHGISVTLRLPPDGGTTAEASLPAALLSAGGPPAEAGGSLPGTGGAAAAASPPLAPRLPGPDEVPAWETLPAWEVLPAGPAAALPDEALPAGPWALQPEDISPASPWAAQPEDARPASPWAAQPEEVPPADPWAAQPDEALAARSWGAQPEEVREPARPRGGAGNGASPRAVTAEAAEIGRSRLASFQRGSRRAQADRGAAQPARDR
jgi:signal transduction histidine kinase